jgi:hypothetical protein
MKKIIIPTIAIIAFLIILATANAQMLSIEDVDVKVDGDKESGSKIDVKPGQEVEFKIKVKNLYTVNTGYEIEDIDISLTIENLDDGEDLDEDLNDFDLDYGDSKYKEISIRIPYDTEEEEYDAVIKIDGVSQDGEIHKASATYTINVERDNNEIQILKAEAAGAAKCGNPVLIEVDIVNIGNADEDVELNIVNANLGIDFTSAFELDDNPDDSDNRLQKLYKIGYLREDAVPGVYTFIVEATYDDGSESESTSTSVTVLECSGSASSQQMQQNNEPEIEHTVQVIKQPTTKTTTVDEVKDADYLPWAIGVLVAIFVIIMIVITVINARKN